MEPSWAVLVTRIFGPITDEREASSTGCLRSMLYFAVPMLHFMLSWQILRACMNGGFA